MYNLLSRILPERIVKLTFFRERKYAAEPTAKQGGLCAAQSPPWTLWILDLFKLKREDRIGKVTNFRATVRRTFSFLVSIAPLSLYSQKILQKR